MRTTGWVERSKVRARGWGAGLHAARSEGAEGERRVEEGGWGERGLGEGGCFVVAS